MPLPSSPSSRHRPSAGGEGQHLVLNSPAYSLTLVPARGAALGLLDRRLGRELIDAGDVYALGQVLYATGGAGTRLLSNQADLPERDPAVSGAFELLAVETDSDDLGQRAILRGTTAAGEVEITWTLPAHAPEVVVHYTLRKPERRDLYEAVYIAFPLALPGARVLSDSQLGWVDWNADRLPGACLEWLPLQSSVRVEAPGCAVCLASPQVPLFCVGDIVRGRWPAAGNLSGGRLFSYVLNNYWRTNYRASQGGTFDFRYHLTSAGRIPPDRAYRFGWAARRPLYAQRLSLQEYRQPPPPYAAPEGGTLAMLTPESVVLTTLRAASGGGWLARLQETAGRPQTATLSFPASRILRAWSTDLLGRENAPLPIEDTGAVKTELPAWGLATLRLEVAA
jgi:hypothetical protein